jgi:hypothetical protein
MEIQLGRVRAESAYSNCRATQRRKSSVRLVWDRDGRWDNRWVPSDEPTTEDGGAASEVERPAETAMSGEMPADVDKCSVPVPEEPSPARSEGEARVENIGQNQPDKESARTADESDPGQTEATPCSSSAGSDGQLLALERHRDRQGNIDTRPPAREAIAFRSVTLAEVYVGQVADALTTTLGAIEWANFRRPIVDDIAQARLGDYYAWGNFWLVSDRSRGCRPLWSDESTLGYRPHLR